MSDDRFEKWAKSQKHIRGTLHPIVQAYTKNTTIGVFSLNPPSVINRPPQNVFETLKARGYTRLYVLYLFSRIGDFSELSKMPVEELIDQRCDEVIQEIMPDVEKVFFAYGDPSSNEAASVIAKRVSVVRKLILKIKPETKILKFGELSKNGFPKSLNSLQSDDVESEF